MDKNATVVEYDYDATPEMPSDIQGIWEHWEIQQALLAGDLDRAAELAEMIGLVEWM